MTVKRLTKRRTTLEKQQATVVSDLLTGLKPVEVAAKYKVSRSAVTQFIERHRQEITALELEADRTILTYAIAHRPYRIAQLDSIFHETTQWLADQGYSEKTQRFDRDGNVVGETTRFRSDALAQLRGLLDDAAKEMGDRGKGDTTNVVAGVINIIRGGTPLGMAPIDHSLIVEGEVLDASDTANG